MLSEISPLTRSGPAPGLRPQDGLRAIPAHAGRTCTAAISSSATSSYPRSRGSGLTLNVVGRCRDELSPLTRGGRASTSGCWAPARAIPAHAGLTHAYSPCWTHSASYPRSRGADTSSAVAGTCMNELSPLTRVGHVVCGGHSRGHRAIPAHAGRTYTAAIS